MSVLYDSFEGHPLRAPCDLVFDGAGGFWFTDHGHSHGDAREWGCVYYARADGSSLTRVLARMDTPNGIGLSPDGATLYVAETNPARLWAFALSEPGVLDPTRHDVRRRPRYGGRVLHGMGGYHLFDSLAVDANGNINVATMGEHTGIAVVSPGGGLLAFVDVDDPAVTNLCFGGPGLRTAFVTLAASGRIVALDWPRAGLPLAHQEYA
jgi:gluconolactonase